MESKKDFLSYISKCIKQQGSYAAAALAPLLNKLVEKVFKNTEDLEKLAASGANGGGILQFVAYLEDRPVFGNEMDNVLIYRLTNKQEDIDKFLDAVQSEANSIVPIVYFKFQGRFRRTDIWRDSREFGKTGIEKFIITNQHTGESAITIQLSRSVGDSGAIIPIE